MSKSHAALTLPSGYQLELPIRTSTSGPSGIEINNLYRETGYVTYDPGFVSTASCNSSITYIDGEKGILLYRGYPIEELATDSSSLEVAYLLLYGDLPTQEQLVCFEEIILRHTMINENIKRLYNGFYHDAHPMAVMISVIGSLSAFYHDSIDIEDPKHREITAHRLIAKIPTIAGACFKHSLGEPFMYPLNKLSYTGNLLQMMFGVPCEEYQVNPLAEKALDLLLILHADHEQNASTATVRQAASSGANPFACIAAGLASLWGPAHGGANEAVLKMLHEIGAPQQISRYIAKAKDKDDPFRLMGFGHRIYKNYDPRARIIRDVCHQVLEKLGDPNDPLLELALQLEKIASHDDYFVERKLYPNVDFYSGIMYQALNIPISMFTVMFAIARSVGWVAHWMEMMSQPEQKRILRPRQVYVGEQRRSYVQIEERRTKKAPDPTTVHRRA